MTVELDNSHGLISELQQHSEALLEKNCYFESVIAELEEKNKKLTELLNATVFDKAQQYKEKVIGKLMEKVERRASPALHQTSRAHQESLSVWNQSRAEDECDFNHQYQLVQR